MENTFFKGILVALTLSFMFFWLPLVMLVKHFWF